MDAGDPDGNSILFQLLFLAFLTLVNAFFAGAEMAVVSVNKNRIKVLADEGSKRAALLQTLFEDSTKFYQRYRWQSHWRDFSQVLLRQLVFHRCWADGSHSSGFRTAIRSLL